MQILLEKVGSLVLENILQWKGDLSLIKFTYGEKATNFEEIYLFFNHYKVGDFFKILWPSQNI